ncbi:MAG: type I methionyl aminopeptidase [Bdellovibrionales bacterium]|nr:type I methionyl aminopeptidase [Bdellovibrionales bacterium]
MHPLNEKEISLMRSVGRLSSRILAQVGKMVEPGVSTESLDREAHKLTLSAGAIPAPLGYKGYPKSICTSVNHSICHGLPGPYLLREGDIINIDITCIKEGFHGDTSRTFYVGLVSKRAKAITECAYKAMMKGIEQVKAGNSTGDIGFAINKYVVRKGFYPVMEIGGHGVGRSFHEDPFVPSYGKKGRGDVLQANCCITVEPMVNETEAPIKEFDIPNSEIRFYETSDQTLSAQFEHTVLIKEDGYEILTLPETDFEIGY